MGGSILALFFVLDDTPLGNLFLSDGLICHGRLWWALLEGRLLVGFGRACSPYAFDYHLTVAFTYILGTLIGRDLPLLLVKLVNISSCDDLLASTQILDIAATLTRLLSGLLTASVMAVFLWNRVLLRHVHVAVIGVIETGLGSHCVGIRACRLCRHQGHLCRVHSCATICAGRYSLILIRATGVGIEVCTAGGLACGAISFVSLGLAKAFMIWPWILFWRCSWSQLCYVGPLDRLKLRKRVLLRLGYHILICQRWSGFVWRKLLLRVCAMVLYVFLTSSLLGEHQRILDRLVSISMWVNYTNARLLLWRRITLCRCHVGLWAPICMTRCLMEIRSRS